MITDDTIKKVAKSARLELKEEEFAKFKQDFSEVVEFFSILESADTTDIERPSVVPIEMTRELREDIARDFGKKKECLDLSKHKTDDYFKGPKAF